MVSTSQRGSATRDEKTWPFQSGGPRATWDRPIQQRSLLFLCSRFRQHVVIKRVNLCWVADFTHVSHCRICSGVADLKLEQETGGTFRYRGKNHHRCYWQHLKYQKILRCCWQEAIWQVANRFRSVFGSVWASDTSMSRFNVRTVSHPNVKNRTRSPPSKRLRKHWVSILSARPRKCSSMTAW